jgi:hypothetical protein
MIPREEILKKINRFYDILESIDEQTKADDVQIENNLKLFRTYFELTSKVGPKMMDAIDELKTKLDSLTIK